LARPLAPVLINLQDKPQWFKDMVPTALVPAIKFADTEQVVWESLDIIKALDDYGSHLSGGDAAAGSAATRLLPAPGDAAAEALHAANLALVRAKIYAAMFLLNLVSVLGGG
jgi:glutathione S-transferase